MLNDDLRILWVMADNQVNDKTLRCIDGLGLREHIQFAIDPQSRAIDALASGSRIRWRSRRACRIRPATCSIATRVRFVDVRRDYHMWLDPSLMREALAEVP